MSTPKLELRNVRKSFENKLVLHDVDLAIGHHDVVCLIGASGSGKSTLARAILGLVKPNRGRVMWMGENLTKLDDESMRQRRKELQIVFQAPVASLDPRMTAGDIISEPLWTFYPNMDRVQIDERTRGMMKMVGLLPNQINRYPHEFSGGQCQRIGIARSLVLNPRLIICDEPVSALDVSIQAQIINLLRDLQREFGLTYLFISHDLSVVQYISDRVAVMYLGKIVETAPTRIPTTSQIGTPSIARSAQIIGRNPHLDRTTASSPSSSWWC